MQNKYLNTAENRLKTYGIILASGTGRRFGADIPKQFIKLNGKTLFEYAAEAFENALCIDEIIAVITPEYRETAEKILLQNNYKKISKLLNGGETRKDSSYTGISAVKDKEAFVLIHDCARPFVSQKIIQTVSDSLKTYKAVCTAVSCNDTIIEADENNIIKNIPQRAQLRRAQTPQGFLLSVIKKAHELAADDKNFTDDCGLVLKYKTADIHIIEGSEENIKITYPSDIYTAEMLLKSAGIKY